MEKSRNKKTVVILGAGPAGLSAAYSLYQRGYNVYIIDHAHYVGGASASFKIKDYIVDYGPHAFHIKTNEIVKMAKDLIGDEYVEVRRKSRLILDGKNLQYPLNIGEALLNINPVLSLNIIFDYFWAKIKNFPNNSDRHIETFEEWGVKVFGYTLYRLAFGDYSKKMWGLPGSKLSKNLAQQKLLKLNLWKLILKAFGIGDTTFEGGVTKYYDMYPRFGIGTIFDKMAEALLKEGGNGIFLDSQVLEIEILSGMAKSISFQYSNKKKVLNFDYLISTIPLKYLTEYLGVPNKEYLLNQAKQLKYRDIRVIYIVMNKDYYSDVHWIYLLGSHFRFNRLSEQKNLNKESSPPGKTVISLDISCNCGDDIWNMKDEELFKLALNDLGYMGIEKSHILDYFTLKLEDVYPVYDMGFDKNLRRLIEIISRYSNVYSTGRQGLFLNNDIHDSMEMGMLAGEFIINDKKSSQWYEYIDKYIKEKLEGKSK